MRKSSSSFQNFRIHYKDGNIAEALFSFSFDGARVSARIASEDGGWYIERYSRVVAAGEAPWRAVVKLLKNHRTASIFELSGIEETVSIKHWDDWRAQAIAVALLHDEWDGENVYADMLLSFSDEQLERLWLDYKGSLLGDFVSNLRALRFLELDDYAKFRTNQLGAVFAQYGYLTASMTAEDVFGRLHGAVEESKREDVGVVDRTPGKRRAWNGPFEAFEIHVARQFVQYWNVHYSFSVDHDAVFRFEFTSNGTISWNDLSYQQLHGSSAWRAALRKAATLDVSMLAPHHVRSFQLSGWNDWRAELVVVALLRDRFRRESRYGKALLSLTVRQAKQLYREFGSFMKPPYEFIEFLKRFRELDAIPDYDRNDLRGFLERYGYGKRGVSTRRVLGRAEAEHNEALAARPPAPPEPPRTGGRVIYGGFRLAEESGIAGMTLTTVGGGTIARKDDELK